jgi:ComF family protein
MRAIQQFKYSGGLHLAKEMAEVMAAAVSSFYSGVTFDLVLGVPLFARKERERGYNQAALLADKISRVLGVDSFNRAASRIRDTGTQTELKASQRKKNVRGAFNIEQRDWISERHILVVDDVITTGATVAELSRALKEEGAGSVRVISLARG